MQLPLRSIAMVALLSVVLPLPRWYTDEGSLVREALAMLWLPSLAREALMHPLCFSLLVYYLVLRLAYFVVGYPVRFFLLRFGLHVSSFSGSSVGGLTIKLRMQDKAEVVVHVDELGIDVRTMRRLRMRLRAQWMGLRRRFWASPAEHSPEAKAAAVDTHSAQAAATASVPPSSSLPLADGASGRASSESCPQGTPLGVGADNNNNRDGALSKRLELYARGVRIQLFAAPPPGAEDGTGGDSLWMFEGAGGDRGPTAQAAPTGGPGDASVGGQVLDREAQELAARLAKKISAILRTYAYMASLFAQWVDISVVDISLMVARSGELARNGRGITVNVSQATMWAESARESRGASAGPSWTPTEIRNSLHGILDWLLGVLNLRRADQDMDAGETSDESASHERLHRLARVQRRRRSHKYLSTLALEATGIRLFAGIEGAQQHMNSRWELVKLLVMQDMLASQPGGDSARPHHRGPVVNCQRCVVRNDVITTFWGLPKKVDQSIEFGQTHVRAGVVESLLDEIAILRLDPGARSAGHSARGLNGLTGRLATVLDERMGERSGEPGSDAGAGGCDGQGEDSGSSEGDTAAGIAEARRQVNRMLFLLHEVLSQLRLEHVGLALRVSELVVDLPLTPNEGALVVSAPAMLRWRQRSVDLEAGYMWSSISSTLGSAVNASRLSAEDRGSGDSMQRPWHDGPSDAFAFAFGDQSPRRPKDSTAFVRVALGTAQAIALRTPSMTSDPRAEELQPDTPGFRMGRCTLYSEMSAFLSEDLSQMPSPQPTVFVDVGRPELLLDLTTQLAFDQAGQWAECIGRRLRTIHQILSIVQPSGAQPDAGDTGGAINHHLHALVDLVLSDVKAQVTVERALWAVLPKVPPVSEVAERIALRMHHCECHLIWSLAGRRRGPSLMPAVKFRMTSSPIAARWENQEPGAPHRELLQVKRGIRAQGSIDLCLGPVLGERPRANVDASIEVGEVLGMLREHEFKTWLAMQPLWLVSRLTHAARSVFKQSGAQPGVSEPSGSHAVPPLEMRRRKLTATAAVQFDHVWVTVMASDSDEDARSGIEHGMQISLSRGTAAVRANGGSAESPHPFGLREDAAPITLNVECQRAQMFLLSAVPVGAARSETKQYSDIPAAFSREALCGWLPDMIQEHVVLVCPRLNLSRHKLEPHRARLIVDLEAASITGVNSVDSVYRWAVVMHHINYWRRRNKLARHMATLSETPRLPDDMLVSISSELADLQGDLASPVFFDVGRGFTLDKSRASTQPPQLKLKVPQLRLTIERTKHGTDSDLLITAHGPIATLYGSSTPKGQTVRVGMQPLLCLDACKATFRFLRKDKRQKLGAEQGVRANSTHNKIDIAFSRGAMAFGHRYNMAETIDGYSLMQKGCKRIARKSMATCHPPLPFAESALKQRPTPRQVLAALGDPRTFTPPALRAQCTHKPAQPPKLSKPDDIPTIDLHGPELTIMVHDDPLETALSQIYQVGLREQRERLSRLEAFDAKAREIRQARARTAAQQSASGKARMRPQAAGRRHARAAAGGNRRTRNRLPSDMRMSRGANTRGSTEQLRTTPPANPRLGAMRAQTFVTAQSRHSLEQSAGVPDSGDLLGMHATASASMQDVTSYVPERRAAQRVRTTSAAADSPYQSSPSLAAAASDTDAQYSSDADADDDGGAGAVEAEIGAAFQRLMRVESSEWIKAIRKRMVPPQGDGPERQVAGMDFSEIFDMPAAASPGYREHLCGSSSARPPYNYSPASWTHPPVPLSRLVMAPAWITLDTPLPLLEFAQVESYLRHLDPATPRQLEWSTLTPMRLRIKGGDVRMQLRDFPFPVFCVPDPYSQKVAPASYDELSGGVEVSGSLIVAERMAHERSLRSVYIPIGPRSRDSDIDLPDVGWHMAKSLQFPRLFAALSIMMFSAPADEGDSIQLRLPPLPIMSSWGTCYQPVISALMQCLESATSKSADVSPSLPWWDKVRSRLHLKCRMSVIEATPLEKERDADAASERGQMFCLALDGRDPYQVTKRPGSYLFTMRGGVRLCVNEGIPSKELCDVQSGRGIYSVPTEDDAPVASATLSELMQLRCDEFLMGVPIVVDRKVALQRLAGPGPDLGGECVLSPGEALKPPAETARAASERRQSMELLRNISADSGTRYTFVTRDLDQLYYKVLLHLSGGVRMGIGLSPYIPPGGAGLRHNHWEVHPIAPESARAMSLLGITDAYSGYRSTRLHASVSLLCPFTSTEEATPRPFAELYLTRTEGSALRLRDPDERVQQKSPGQWAAYDIDGLVSPMHSLFADTQELPDQFFTPFARASGEPSVRPTQASPMEQRSCTLPQCQISASAAVLHGIMAYLSHYVSRMMLPVRKGSLYPFTETSDNKVVKCMRSMRLVLDLKNVELAYSQRDYEIKELETRELEILDCVDQGLSPTPSDVSGQGPATSAKAEGTVRQLKARVDSFSFNLLLEQSLVKIRVGAQGVGDAVLADDDMTRGQRARRRSRSADRVLSPPPQRRPGGPPNNVEEATALRWGVGDGSLEIDYLDVRLVQSTFLLPLFASTAGLLGRCQPVNGLHFRCGSLDGISQMDQSWISCASVRDLNELDLSGAEFSSPSVTCVLWSPRLVYFTQRPELHQVDGRLDDILDAGNVLSGLMPSAADATHNPFAASPARTGAYPPDLRNPATDPAVASLINNPLLQRSLSVQRARAMSDLLDPSQLGRVGTGESTGSEADSSRPAVHRRNTSMPWAADAHGRLPSQLNIPGQAAQNGPHTAGAGASPLPDPGDAKTPVSAMSYKSSFHLLEIARTRQRRLTASTSRQSVGRALSPVQSLRRVGSEHDLADMQRQTSFQMDPSAGQAARMAPTGPDPKVIMRDSRSTQASLLQKRKQMLGDAIRLEQTALAQLSKEFERAPGKHNEYFRERMLQHAEHIYELSARRKLINRCMAVLGVSVDSEPACAETRDQEDVDYDRDTQEVEKVLASLYRHRCLIYSGYLIWTTQVRDKLMRFLYIQDCLTAVEYYMSESATSVVRKATTLRDSTGGKEASAPAAPPAESESKADRTADKPEAARARPSEDRPTPLRHRSSSQRSDGSTSSRRGLQIPRLLQRMRSYDNARGSSNATPKRQQRAPKRSSRRTSSSKQRSEGEASGLHNRFERGLAQIWDDFNRYQPYYSILVEFLNSQVSLRVDEGTSTRSAIAVAERVQLHRILLCDEDRPSGPHDDESMRSSPPTDESVVKARSMVELENVQVFTVNRGDFENRAAYFADCTYGSPLNDSATQPAALWPAWVPIELLLDQGTDKTRGIFDESDKSAESGSADQSGPPGAEAEGRRESAGYGNAWWLEDLSKYKRLMNRDSGLLVYDRANPLCIRGDTKDNAVRDTSSHAQAASAGDPAASPSALGAGMRSAEASVHSGEQDGDSLSGESESGDDPAADAAAADDVDAPDSGQGVSHHANHISVFLPEVNLACTAEQYTTAYEIVTELLVFIDPEKAMYMDHLNTIQLGMDMDDLRGLLSIIRATQSALRERIPMIHDWYALHRGRAAFSSRPGVGGDGGLSRESAWSRSPAASLLTLGRHRQALELQLRTALDLIGVAQKQIRQQQQQQKSHGLWPGNARGKGQPSKPLHPSAGDRAAGRRPSQSSAQSTRPLSAAAGGQARAASPASARSSRRGAEETNNAIARTIRLFINRASWHMLENDEQPLCDVVLRWASLRAVTMADQATHLVSEVHLLYVINRLPNPMFTDLVGPYIRPKEPAPDFCVQKMLRFRWSELAPVGGITIVERFEVDLFPLRLQLSYDIAQKLINYLYPPQDSGGADASLGQGTVPSRRQRRSTMASIASDETEASAGDTPSATSPTPGASSDGLPRAEPGDSPSTHASGTASPRTATSARFGTLGSSGRSLFAAKMKRAADGQTAGQRASSEEPPTAAPGDTAHLQRTASGLLSTIAGYAGPIPLLTENGSMANIPQGSDNRGQVDEMKKRASSNKTFLNVKIGGSTLCISYQGRRTNNITDLRDFEFRAPTLVLRNEVESYFELLMQVKREYRSVVVQHTGALVKEKFRQLHNRKAWSKTSSGPDWAARRLLIDMDRRIDQEMLASMRGAVHDVTAAAPALGPGCAFEHAPGSAPPASQEAVAAGEPSPALSTASVSDDPLARSAPSPGPSAARGIAAPGDPAKGKAPLSKYMILDPRKLMGKRLPSVLPRNIAPAGPGHSGSPSPHLPAEDGGAHRVSALASESGPRAVYSAMHADMAPAMLQQTRPATADSSSSSSSRLTGAARQPARQAPLFQRRFTASLSPASPGASPRFGPAEKTGSAPDADVVHPSQ